MTDFQALIPFELLRYGIEQSNDTEQLIDLLSGMSETQNDEFGSNILKSILKCKYKLIYSEKGQV